MNSDLLEPTEARAVPRMVSTEEPDELRRLLIDGDYEREMERCRRIQDQNRREQEARLGGLEVDYGLDDEPCPFRNTLCSADFLCGQCTAAGRMNGGPE